MQRLWLGCAGASAVLASSLSLSPSRLLTAQSQDSGSSGGAFEALPMDKLACQMRRDGASHKPVVLVSCGSFNPPTNMHLRMFELARDHLTQAGFDVLGGYLSPVNDAYTKPGLAPAKHRIAMARAASSSSDLIMVDSWEALQSSYQRSLRVLEHVKSSLHTALSGSPQGSDLSEDSKPEVRVMLLCGSDMVESFMKPGLWKPDHLAAILDEHGVVCIARNAQSLESFASREDSILRNHKEGLFFVQEPVGNELSSSIIRSLISQIEKFDPKRDELFLKGTANCRGSRSNT